MTGCLVALLVEILPVLAILALFLLIRKRFSYHIFLLTNNNLLNKCRLLAKAE